MLVWSSLTPEGGLLGTPNWLFVWDLAEERGIPLMAGFPLSKPESVLPLQSPGTQMPCPKGRYLFAAPKVSAPPDSAPGRSAAPGTISQAWTEGAVWKMSNTVTEHL